MNLKKTILTLAFAGLVSFTICAKGNKTSPDFSPNAGKIIDDYWTAYFETKDTENIDKIIEYVDVPDEIFIQLNKNYKAVSKDEDAMSFLIDGFHVETTGKKFVYDAADLEWIFISVLKGQDDYHKAQVQNIFSYLPQETIIHAAVKSSAYWSLSSNAEQHEDVKDYIAQKVPFMNQKTKAIFTVIYGF